MIPALIALLLSWILLHFIENQNLEVLGFRPTKHRLWLVAQGFLLTAAFMTIYYLIEAATWSVSYHPNPGFNGEWLEDDLWRVFTSALFEELLFRGALLYILIRRIGAPKAILVSAIAFGMYHWITVGIHSLAQMALLFASMAWMGYALARSFVVSGSILVPLTLHFASNLVGATIFGFMEQLYIRPTGVHPSIALILLLTTIHNFVYPLIVLWWLRSVKPISK